PADASIFMTTGTLQLWDHGRRLPYRAMTWPGDAGRLTGPARDRPDWIVVEQSPLYHYSAVPEAVTAILPEYELEYAIRAWADSPAHVYDQQDEFYLPLDGFKGIRRPGPNVLVYRRSTPGGVVSEPPALPATHWSPRPSQSR